MYIYCTTKQNIKVFYFSTTLLFYCFSILCYLIQEGNIVSFTQLYIQCFCGVMQGMRSTHTYFSVTFGIPTVSPLMHIILLGCVLGFFPRMMKA